MMSYIPIAASPEYSTVTLQVGLKERLRCLHISDTHLLFSDGRDCRAKYDVALRRWGEYVYANVGRNVTYFLDALLYAKRNGLLLLHTGDLIDFYSPANLEAAERLLVLAGVNCFLCAGNHEYTNYSGQHPESPEEQEEARREVPKILLPESSAESTLSPLTTARDFSRRNHSTSLMRKPPGGCR